MKTGIAATVLVVGSLFASACVGDIESDGVTDTGTVTTGSTPKQTFDRDVDTILATKCVGCHQHDATNANFVATTPAAEYATITALSQVVGDYARADAPVLVKVLPGHHGVTYTTDEVAKISNWLDQEVAARHTTPTPGPGPGTANPIGPEAIHAAEDAWSGCITAGDFNAANMAQAWGNLRATEPDEQCQTCHVTGGNDFVASDNAPQFLRLMSTTRKYLLQYFAVDTTQGRPIMVVNYTSFNLVSGGAVGQHIEHPTFAFNNDGMQALEQLYALAGQRLAAGGCGPSTLKD